MKKKKLQKEMDDISKLRNVGYQGPLESVNEGPSTEEKEFKC